MGLVSYVAEVSTGRDCVTRKTNRTERTRMGGTSGREIATGGAADQCSLEGLNCSGTVTELVKFGRLGYKGMGDCLRHTTRRLTRPAISNT